MEAESGLQTIELIVLDEEEMLGRPVHNCSCHDSNLMMCGKILTGKFVDSKTPVTCGECVERRLIKGTTVKYCKEGTCAAAVNCNTKGI